MRKMLKKLVYSPLVLAALLVALVGVRPMCSGVWTYQPAPPTE
ncbi:MAG: AgrD family cyclic lactone autoinducer peptide [Desulfocucumaceae bacterium]